MSYYLIVAGSRNFNDYEKMCLYLDDLLEYVEPNVTIISGAAKGADTLGERYANDRGYGIIRMPADWNKEGRRAGWLRNNAMADKVIQHGYGGCACFWDGKSPGTKMMIDICNKKNIDCYICNY